MLKELDELVVGDIFVEDIDNSKFELGKYRIVTNIDDDKTITTKRISASLIPNVPRIQSVIMKKMSMDISNLKGLNHELVEALKEKITYNVVENIGDVSKLKNSELSELLISYKERHIDVKIEQIFQ